MSRLALPRAYLRMSPNLDQHPDPEGMVLLLCAANRQPGRGRFRDRETLVRALGRARLKRLEERGDIVPIEDGWYVEGWDEWQEGDLTVAERQHRIRERKANGATPAERTALWRLRTSVFERDGYRCRYCGSADSRQWLVAEHVDPDGPTDAENLVTACRSCNKRKGGRTPEEAGMPLLPVPGDASQSGTGDASRAPGVTGHDRDSLSDARDDRRKTERTDVRSSRAREGLPHVTDAIAKAWEAASGKSVLASGAFAAEYLDDVAERLDEPGVLAGIRAARATFPRVPSTQALAAAVRGILDPLPRTAGGAPPRRGRGYLPSSKEMNDAFEH